MQRDGTVPLDETFTETIEHYGRSYQHYSLTNGTYFAPIDEDEISRLEVMHGVLSRLFDGRLIFPPIRSPRRILDCGCGPGDWAIEVATQYPDAEVLGIDVSPHMIPENPPDNMELQVDDLNGRQVASPGHGNFCILTILPSRPRPVAMVQTILGKPAAIQRSAGTTSISQLDEKRRFYGSRVETLDVANVRLVECSSEERSQQPSIQGTFSRFLAQKGANPDLKQGFVGWTGKRQWRAIEWIIEEGWRKILRFVAEHGKHGLALTGHEGSNNGWKEK
ncbi:hypothetical protein IWW34DRAFT_809397 [Fusarium oxysporum f. sp. albedinis]|nr:hypothetical protein IWW34DRAFT_809397 [Fusarium oxysporum f. sp. albedinis]